jgi:hypothetical protein
MHGEMPETKNMLETSFLVDRRGQEVEVSLQWEVQASMRSWSESHPYGMGTAAEPMSECSIDGVELQKEDWPPEFENEFLTPQEFDRARAEATEKAEEEPYNYVAEPVG